MFTFETRPGHFLIPTPLFIIGGIFVSLPGRLDVWDWIGALIIVNGVALIGFLWYWAVKDQDLKRIQEEHYHYAEIIKLDVAKTSTKVVIDKTAIVGNELSQSYSVLQIQPAKLKIFATRALDGHKLTLREWTPMKEGKLFSRNEWERLIAFMEKPVKDDPRVKFVTMINPKNINDGHELTPAGRKWLENIAYVNVLTPS